MTLVLFVSHTLSVSLFVIRELLWQAKLCQRLQNASVAARLIDNDDIVAAVIAVVAVALVADVVAVCAATTITNAA